MADPSCLLLGRLSDRSIREYTGPSLLDRSKDGARPFEIRFVTGFVTTQAARHRHLSLSQ